MQGRRQAFLSLKARLRNEGEVLMPWNKTKKEQETWSLSYCQVIVYLEPAVWAHRKPCSLVLQQDGPFIHSANAHSVFTLYQTLSWSGDKWGTVSVFQVKKGKREEKMWGRKEDSVILMFISEALRNTSSERLSKWLSHAAWKKLDNDSLLRHCLITTVCGHSWFNLRDETLACKITFFTTEERYGQYDTGTRIDINISGIESKVQI